MPGKRGITNGAVKDAKDPLSLQGGPITRVKAKKMRETLNGLIESQTRLY